MAKDDIQQCIRCDVVSPESEMIPLDEGEGEDWPPEFWIHRACMHDYRLAGVKKLASTMAAAGQLLLDQEKASTLPDLGKAQFAAGLAKAGHKACAATERMSAAVDQADDLISQLTADANAQAQLKNALLDGTEAFIAKARELGFPAPDV